MADLFKVAAKNKYRFNFRGLITVEDLWDLSVNDLDSIYKDLKVKQKNDNSEFSLLDKKTAEDVELNNKLEIVKDIVEEKLRDIERASKAAERKAKKQRILEIMADKQDQSLKDKSIDELKEMLSDIDSED